MAKTLHDAYHMIGKTPLLNLDAYTHPIHPSLLRFKMGIYNVDGKEALKNAHTMLLKAMATGLITGDDHCPCSPQLQKMLLDCLNSLGFREVYWKPTPWDSPDAWWKQIDKNGMDLAEAARTRAIQYNKAFTVEELRDMFYALREVLPCPLCAEVNTCTYDGASRQFRIKCASCSATPGKGACIGAWVEGLAAGRLVIDLDQYPIAELLSLEDRTLRAPSPDQVNPPPALIQPPPLPQIDNPHTERTPSLSPSPTSRQTSRQGRAILSRQGRASTSQQGRASTTHQGRGNTCRRGRGFASRRGRAGTSRQVPISTQEEEQESDSDLDFNPPEESSTRRKGKARQIEEVNMSDGSDRDGSDADQRQDSGDEEVLDQRLEDGNRQRSDAAIEKRATLARRKRRLALDEDLNDEDYIDQPVTRRRKRRQQAAVTPSDEEDEHVLGTDEEGTLPPSPQRQRRNHSPVRTFAEGTLLEDQLRPICSGDDTFGEDMDDWGEVERLPGSNTIRITRGFVPDNAMAQYAAVSFLVYGTFRKANLCKSNALAWLKTHATFLLGGQKKHKGAAPVLRRLKKKKTPGNDRTLAAMACRYTPLLVARVQEDRSLRFDYYPNNRQASYHGIYIEDDRYELMFTE